MRKFKNYLPIIGVFLLVVVGIVYYYNEMKDYSEEIQKQTIVVAATNIPENTVITEQMLETKDLYVGDLLAEKEYITKDIKKVVGKRTLVPIYQGEKINLNRLLENKEYMKNNQDKTMIALQLIKTDQALGLKAGEYIDIWAVTRNDFDTFAQKIIEKIKIEEIKTEVYKNIESGESQDKNGEVGSFITLQLTDDEISTIYSLPQDLYEIRVAKHGENKLMQMLNKNVKENKKIETQQEQEMIHEQITTISEKE